MSNEVNLVVTNKSEQVLNKNYEAIVYAGICEDGALDMGLNFSNVEQDEEDLALMLQALVTGVISTLVRFDPEIETGMDALKVVTRLTDVALQALQEEDNIEGGQQ